jgi:tetratricopeptide (TPR) repeat protein
MHLATELLRELETPGLSRNQRALLRCQLARQFERGSNYEAAEEAMKELWQGVGMRPILEGLDSETKAEVLLRTGALTGWIGSANQIEGSQEMAKDLISESARAFQKLGQRNKVGEARSEMGLCYWREGAFDEARVTLQQALDEFDDADLEQRAIALLRKGIVERTSGRLNEALRVYNEAATLFDQVTDDLLTAQFHHAFANALKHVVQAEKREDYADRAFMEYTAASYHFERAGHIRYQACVENNIGSLLGIIGKYEDAHEHLDQAQMIVTRLKDNVRLAQFDETRARVLLAEGRDVEAEKTVRAAVRILEKGEELSLLAEALTTHGIALVRLEHSDQARTAFERAITVAEQVGDFESAGVSALTIIEVLGASLSNEEVWATIDHAGLLLEKTEDNATLRRLANAFRSLFLTHAMPTPSDWTNFSFKRAVQRYEGHLIKLALRETGGRVTAAARLLGFNHHQSLIALIESRHKDLLTKRSPVRKRRHHLMAHPKRKRKQSE